MNLRSNLGTVLLGVALIADIAGIVVLGAVGTGLGRLDELAFALAAGLAGVTMPRSTP